MSEDNNILPPHIKQYFNYALLATPCASFKDDCNRIKSMLLSIEGLWYKLKSNPIKKKRCESLKKELLELYERAKEKEKERESQTDHKTQGFGYSFVGSNKNDADVYWRLMFRRKTGAPRFGR